MLKYSERNGIKGNSTYGITIDQYSAMYDPRTGREICIFGQLLMTDLIDKLEKQLGDRCVPIQYNTDGIIMKLLDKNDYDEYLEVCNKWSERTRLNLEHDLIKKIYISIVIIKLTILTYLLV